MKRTHVAAVATLAAVSMIGSTGATEARWHQETTIQGVELSAGVLDVAIDPLDIPAGLVTLQPGSRLTMPTRVHVDVVGGNALAALRLDVPEWADLVGPGRALDVTIDVPALGVTGHRPGSDVVAWVAPSGSTVEPPDAVAVATAGTVLAVEVTLAVSSYAGNGYQALRLPDDGHLVAHLSQERAGATAWRDTDRTPLPVIALSSVDLVLARAPWPAEPVPVAPQAPDAEPAPEPDPEPEIPADEEVPT